MSALAITFADMLFNMVDEAVCHEWARTPPELSAYPRLVRAWQADSARYRAVEINSPIAAMFAYSSARSDTRRFATLWIGSRESGQGD